MPNLMWIADQKFLFRVYFLTYIIPTEYRQMIKRFVNKNWKTTSKWAMPPYLWYCRWQHVYCTMAACLLCVSRIGKIPRVCRWLRWKRPWFDMQSDLLGLLHPCTNSNSKIRVIFNKSWRKLYNEQIHGLLIPSLDLRILLQRTQCT